MTATIIAILCGIALIASLATPKGHELLTGYIRRRRGEGALFDEAFSELVTMEAFVALRRKASDLCVKQDGKISRDQIADIAGELAAGIAAAHGKEAASAFLSWVSQSDLVDILYEDAFDAMRTHQILPKDAKLSADMEAALKSIG